MCASQRILRKIEVDISGQVSLILTLTMLWTESADNILKYFSYFFSRKWDLTLHANCLKYFKMLSTEIFTNMQSVNNLPLLPLLFKCPLYVFL